MLVRSTRAFLFVGASAVLASLMMPWAYAKALADDPAFGHGFTGLQLLQLFYGTWPIAVIAALSALVVLMPKVRFPRTSGTAAIGAGLSWLGFFLPPFLSGRFSSSSDEWGMGVLVSGLGAALLLAGGTRQWLTAEKSLGGATSP